MKVIILRDLKDYKPDLHDELQKIAPVWNDEALRQATLNEIRVGQDSD